MPLLIQNVENYLYTRKRDILLLNMCVKKKDPIVDVWSLDRDACEMEAEEQLKWFSDRGIDSFMTCDISLICGWYGQYYIDVDPADPIVFEYTTRFETEEGKSLYPDKYQMEIVSYLDWVSSGKLDEYEKYLEETSGKI